ncbi:MAG: TIGR00282 family metallophosphoesterase [Patescibacteria group bacterium]|nr:TIGR00282 family metallophosphoesterase [Patescibacteria group bacterium]
MKKINFLIFGDIVGKIGRKALIQNLSNLKAKYKPDLTIANVENLAHGRGITKKTLQEIKDAGVDVFTSGHHVFENQQGLPLLDNEEWSKVLIRPANVGPNLPGSGWIHLNIKDTRVSILNLQGQLFMPQDPSSIFLSFDRFWKEQVNESSKSIIIIDVHAETTSEKNAFANYVDGRANIVFGTHTHVPTADLRVMPNGTVQLTDVGMVGAHDSVIGFEKNSSIKRFLAESTAPYKIPETGPAEINGLFVSLDMDTHKVLKVEQIRETVAI